MDLIANLQIGFGAVLTADAIFYCLLGALLGTLIGVLPGIGPAATISLLLPFTFGIEPLPALIMLSGIYYGSQYGGSTTAILLNLPGESSSVITAVDGYKMARQGKAGKALATAAIGSFVAGCVATIVIAAVAAPVAGLALKFGAPEYFSLVVLGIVTCIVMAHGSVLKAFAMVVLGILLGTVGVDANTGVERFMFGLPGLGDGISFVAAAMGLFGLTEIISNLSGQSDEARGTHKVGSLLLSRKDVRDVTPPILRGTVIGSILGVLPGSGALLASFISYSFEKRIARDPSRFGQGAIEGVAAPEAANNAAAQTSFIPMLTLGIPSNAIMAMMIGAMLIQGVQPGPSMIEKQPELFWGLIASMWIGNAMLLILNLPLVGLWARIISVPYNLLYPFILVLCCVGVFAINNSEFDILLMCGFAVLGVLLTRSGCEPAPLLLGMILGPMLEMYFGRAMALSRGDLTIFVTRPVSAILLAVALGVILLVLLPKFSRAREEAFVE
ncbi:tripartite tricarboxylate transporter permease [Mesorhizobium sp. ANAO-SY3R2]|uniref:tripartite tricarboxylate transporter permease n=1 Tax=Mesorhizobium sp. ANAO-SY3R2 TaxID=3166644 RepID=UPI00366EA9CB